MDYFSVKKSWECLREEYDKVSWAKMIWFSQCISFVVWLAVQDRLKTQDKLLAWGVKKSLICPLCKTVRDSKDHLFFDCKFSKEVWDHNKPLSKLDNAPFNLSYLIVFFDNVPISKSIWSIIQRLEVKLWYTLYGRKEILGCLINFLDQLMM